MKAVSFPALLFSLIAAAPCGFSEEPVLPPLGAAIATNLAGAGIQFASTVYEFGRVIAGEQVRHDFVFTNVGSAVLEISGVYPSCGCTTAGTWSRRVDPGQTGLIPLQFNSSRFMGSIVKTANVICNDPSHPQITLQIKGTIWKPIEVRPQMAVMNAIAGASSNPPVTVSIVSSLEQPLILSNPEVQGGPFAAELKTIQPGREFQLIISPVPPLGPGNVQGTILLKTSYTNVPTLTVTALAIVQPGLVVTPQQITLPPGPLVNAMPFAVSIRHNSGEPLTLSDPAVSAKDVDVQVKEILPGRQYTLMLTFPAGFQIPQGGQVDLTVQTSDPKYPVLKVPIYQGLYGGPPVSHRGPMPPIPTASSHAGGQ